MIRLHLQLPPMLGPTGRIPQRSNPVNPTYRPNQRPPQPVAPTASVQNFHPMKQPLPVGHVDASASGSVPAFQAIEEDPQDEEGDDEAMEPGDLIPGAGVHFIKPTKRKLAMATAVKRVLEKGVFSKGRRSSLIVRAASLSTQDLVLLQEQVTELSNSRQSEDKNEVHDVAERGSDTSATDLEPSAFFEAKAQETKTTF